MPIPETLLKDLQCVPQDRPVALLMRHSNRFPITDPEKNYMVGLTEEGVRLAEQLGGVLREQFRPGRVMSSPVGRCVDTAQAIARGAGWPVEVISNQRLSHEFIASTWSMLEAGQVNDSLPWQVLSTLEFLLDHEQPGPVLDVMVTHDTVLGAVVAALLDAPVTGENWPRFLEGVFIWKDDEEVHLLWRGEEHQLPEGVIS